MIKSGLLRGEATAGKTSWEVVKLVQMRDDKDSGNKLKGHF